MQMQVDFPSVFNTALPKVYIKRVSLYPSTQTGNGNNIAYDTEAEDGLVKNQYGKKRPKATTPRFVDAGSKSKALEVKVEVSIKERIKQDGTTTWYNNSEFNKFLKLKVVLAKNRQAIEDLENGNFTPSFLRKLKRRNNIIEKIITLRKDNTPIVAQKIEMIDGREIYCTTYQVVFKMANINPRNMSIFAATFVDLREYYQYKSPKVKSSRRFFQGTTVSQRVIKAGDVFTESSIYLLPSGKVWAGPIHYHEGSGYMPGAFHSATPHPVLERKKVPNLVIQDFRVFDTLNKAKFLLRPEIKILHKQLETKRAQGSKIVRKNVYITEPSYAFDKENQLRFVFHVDMEKLIAERSQFGACFRQADADAKKDIMNNTKINNLVVLRQRVRQGISNKDTIAVDGRDKIEMIAQSSDGKRSRIKPRRTQRPLNPALVDSEKILTGGIREVKLDIPGATGIRTFTVSDFAMSEKTDGLYSYSVDFDIQDGTAIFVNSQKKKLLQAIDALTKYYGIAKRPENTNITTGLFTDDFIKEMESQYKIPEFNQINVPNRRRRRRAVQSSIAKAPWLNAIAVYSDVMKNLTNVTTSDITRAAFLFHSLVEPSSGTVKGIETLLLSMQNALNKITPSVIGGKNRSGSPLLGTSIKDISTIDYKAKTAAFKGKSPKTTIRLTKRFKTVHDSNVQKSIGYDFLNLRPSNNLGLRVVSTEQIAQRLSLENQKYYSKNIANESEAAFVPPSDSETPEDYTRFINLEDAYYSYLTPAKILYGNKKLKLIGRGRRLWNTKQYESFISSINNGSKMADTLPISVGRTADTQIASRYIPMGPAIDYSSDYDPEKASISKQDYETNAVNSVLLAKYGVSLSTRKTERSFVRSENKLNGLDTEEADLVSPQSLLGLNTAFATGAADDLDQTLEKVKDTQLRDFSSVSNIFIKSSIKAETDILSNKKIGSVKNFRPSDEKNIIDQELEKYNEMENPSDKKQKFISKIPNQIKSIFLGDDTRVNKNWFVFLEKRGLDVVASTAYTGLYYFNYNHINQIEVLSGFGEDKDGNLQASAPIYRVLTKEIFDTIVNSSNSFICRMRTAKVPLFSKSKSLRLPEYDETFILRARTNREDLNADAEIVEIQDESAEDFDLETTDESIFISRLTEYEDLNTTGRRVLRRLIRRDTRLGGLMPEFTSNSFVQQPKRISRTGATFGIDTEQSQGEMASNVASETIATARRSRTPRVTPAQAQTTTATRSASTMASSPSITTSTPSGGGGGVGY